MKTVALALALLGGCKKEDPPAPEPLTDTGWFETETGVIDTQCEDRIVDTVPADGATEVYWRDHPVVYTHTPVEASYGAVLQEATGRRVDAELVWSPAGLSFELVWDGFLSPDTDYELLLTDCASTRVQTFRTSAFGAPLAVEASELVGRTYLLDLVGAQWVEPAALAPLVQVYFTTPILLGVQYADEDHLDLIGVTGSVDPTTGAVDQQPGAETWDFPLSDFAAPYVEVASEQITLVYTDGFVSVDIPVDDFVFQATLGADGTTLGGGVLEGLGDTRNLGTLVGGDDAPDTVCVLAEGLGVDCLPCGDGEPYCLKIRTEQIQGSLVEGLQIDEQG